MIPLIIFRFFAGAGQVLYRASRPIVALMRELHAGFRNYEQVCGLAASAQGLGFRFEPSKSHRTEAASLKNTIVFLSILLLADFVNPHAVAQDALDAGPADARVVSALKQVSADRIRANIEKLVSFGTRSTLSAQDPDSISAGRGIGAAREWIKAEFEGYSQDWGGSVGQYTPERAGEQPLRIA